MVELNPRLQDLLMREAHLRRRRDHLKPVWAAKEAELRAIQAIRPVFLPVFFKKKKEQHEKRLADAQLSVTALRRSMELIDRLEPQVQQLIEETLEAALRRECPAYGQAVAARQQKEDWQCSVARCAERIQEFVGTVGGARTHAATGYSRLANSYSPAAQQAFELAAAAAVAVDEEVRMANRISDAQARRFVESGFAPHPFPRLPETNYVAEVRRISGLPLAETQVQFEQVIEQAIKLYDVGLAELRAQAERVDRLQALDIHNVLFVAWERCRAEVAPQIFAGDTQHIVAETEEMLRTAAEACELPHLTDVAA